MIFIYLTGFFADEDVDEIVWVACCTVKNESLIFRKPLKRYSRLSDCPGMDGKRSERQASNKFLIGRAMCKTNNTMKMMIKVVRRIKPRLRNVKYPTAESVLTRVCPRIARGMLLVRP